MPSHRRRFPPRWAALADKNSGRLPSSVPADALLRARRVAVDGADLVFDWGSGFEVLTPPSALLERFLELSPDAKTIVKFAREFGPMGLSQRNGGAVPHPMAFPLDLRNRIQRESLEHWRHYQWEFNALAALAGAVRERQDPDLIAFEKFEILGEETDPFLGGRDKRKLRELLRGDPAIAGGRGVAGVWSTWSVPFRLEMAHDLIRARIATFTRWCRIRPALGQIPGSRRTVFVFQDATADHPYGFGISLFGALTVQLMAAVVGTEFAACSACGRMYVPDRRPAFGRRRYCTKCRKDGVPVHDAKADYLTRRRERVPTPANRQAGAGSQRRKK